MIFSRQIQQFIILVQKGSYAKAAAEISVTPSALSHGIRDLETRLGKSLIVRNKGSIQLTSDGIFLYNEIMPLYHHSKQIFSTLLDSNDKSDDADVIIKTDGMDYPIITDNVIPLLCDFNRRVSIMKGESERLMNELENDECDIAIMAFVNKPLPELAGLYHLSLSPDTLGLVYHEKLLHRHDSVSSIIANEPLVQYSAALSHPAFRSIKFEMIRHDLPCTTIGVLERADVHCAVVNGVGASLIPESSLHYSDFCMEGLHFEKTPFPFDMRIYQGIYFKQRRFCDLIDIATQLQGKRSA